MSNSPSGFSLSEAELSNGSKLSVVAGDILLVVGPNNSGKSTFLKEIKQYLQDPAKPRHAFSKMTFTGSSEKEMRSRIETYFHVIKEGGLEYVADERGSRDFYINDLSGGAGKVKLGDAVEAFVSFLNSEGRLSLSRDVPTIDLIYNKPRHPYHVFMLNPSALREFSSKIEEAFGLEFTITRIGNPVRGYVGKEFDKEDSVSADRKIPEAGELLQQQGDGLRSYAGIMGEIQSMSHPIILLDEPEAFLHPPQAKRLGRTIVRELDDTRQAFIATHSSDFLQGVLAVPSSRVRVVRLDRTSGPQVATILESGQLKEAVAHPSIANSNLLDALFFDQTVICEGDADCKLLEWLAHESEWGNEHDRFWFSAGGKHQFAKVAGLLQSFGVDWRVVLDLDALTDWEILAELSGQKGFDISPYKARIRGALDAIRPIDLGRLRKEAMKALKEGETDEAALRKAAKVIEGKKFSSALKQYGLAAVPNGQERASVELLLDSLDAMGICLLRRGEIESYVPSVGTHGPSWVSAVLDSHRSYVSELAILRGDIRSALT